MKRSDIKTTLWADTLLWIVPLLLILPNIALCITEQSYSMIDCAVNITLPLGVYYLLFVLSAKTGRTTLFFIPVMVLCAFQIVLLFLYGESIIAIDMFLNVATTSVGEATELLCNLTSAIIAVCVLYLPAIVSGVILCVKGAESGQNARKVSAVAGGALTVAGIVMLIVATASPAGYNPCRKLFPVNVVANMFYAGERTVQTEQYKENAAAFTFHAKDSRPGTAPEVYVLVIGETSRAGNWQLNGYKRPTNPCLAARSGLVFMSKALTESNTTHKSVPLMLSHLTAAEFGDSIYRSKGVVDAFAEAGYATAWLSNQKRNHSLIDFFGEQADSTIFINDDGQDHYDEELCPMLEEFLKSRSSSKRFIVLHTYGSHFNYRDRYPESNRYFMPDEYEDASADYRSELMNAYDNSIRYTDSVLDKIISVVDAMRVPSAVVYLADHGEDIYDDERGRFLHASPTPTYWQVHVPMVVWMSDAYRGTYPQKYACLVANSGKNVSTSRSAFHTLLSLAGVDTPVYDSSAAVTESDYKEVKRVYLNDYDEAVPLVKTGIRKTDMDCLAHARIN